MRTTRHPRFRPRQWSRGAALRRSSRTTGVIALLVAESRADANGHRVDRLRTHRPATVERSTVVDIGLLHDSDVAIAPARRAIGLRGSDHPGRVLGGANLALPSRDNAAVRGNRQDARGEWAARRCRRFAGPDCVAHPAEPCCERREHAQARWRIGRLRRRQARRMTWVVSMMTNTATGPRLPARNAQGRWRARRWCPHRSVGRRLPAAGRRTR
jgi:hypothetical protein